jgi:hypothetical protein
MINVPWSESPQRKYVNPNEIDMGINLLMQLKREYDISSTLVITPVRQECLYGNHSVSSRLTNHAIILSTKTSSVNSSSRLNAITRGDGII